MKNLADPSVKYTPSARPEVVQLNDIVLHEIMYAYLHPNRLSSEHKWIDWVFRLRKSDRRHALEFVEGWDTTRIAITGSIPWTFSCIVGVVWAVRTGDVQTAFSVASFILTSATG
jgi:hypothetical protein